MGETPDFTARSASSRRAYGAGAALAVLLAGPTVLAFFSGGYFDSPRAWAGAIAWALVAVAALLRPGPLPRTRPALIALGGLTALTAWALLSITWAPVRGSAYHAGQIDLLYLGAMLAAALLVRGRAASRAVEPVLAAGTVIVIVYGLSERFLPGLIHLRSSVTGEGRLEQPLSYWNAMGELAALGLVLAVRVAGDLTRPVRLRALAAGATAPLGMGLYLSFSRGAVFAAVAGVLVLIVLVPRREQLHALGIAVAAAVLAALAAAPFRGLTSLGASLSTRETQGAVVLVLLVVIMLAAAVIQVRIAGRPTAPLKLPRRAPWIVLGVICAGLALAIVLGAKETSKLPSGTSAARYTTLQSDRYEYWRVALDAFVDHPINGVGAGGWAVRWLQFRKLQGYAVDAHSLELQTLAELGIVGLALLALLLGGVGLAVRSALTRAGPRVAGPVAGLVVWLAHSPLDWDWQLPALTLVAAVLAGTLLAATEELGMAASRETGERITDPDADPESPARPLTAGNRLAVPR